MTAMATGRRSPMGSADTPSKICRLCGDPFWTQVGLDEHVRVGQHNGTTRRWVTGSVSPAALEVLQRRGRQIAAENNARRRSCDGCGLTSTPAGLGMHQKATGHTGWTEQ